MSNKVKLVKSSRTSQSPGCINVHFGSCEEPGGLWDGMGFSPWSSLGKLFLWLKLVFLIFVLKSLMFLRTHSERQGFINIAIKLKSH